MSPNVLTGSLKLADQTDRPKLIEAMAMCPNLICFDADDDSQDLQKMFPERAFKTTVLCPPPKAMYTLIDGDNVGTFVTEYDKYLLDEESPAREILIMMIALLNKGVDIVIYIPAELEDSIWISAFMNHLQRYYGIIMGTKGAPALYDFNYSRKHVLDLYNHGYLNVYDFLSSFGWFDVETTEPNLIEKIKQDLVLFNGRLSNKELQGIVNNISKAMKTGFEKIVPAVAYLIPPSNE